PARALREHRRRADRKGQCQRRLERRDRRRVQERHRGLQEDRLVLSRRGRARPAPGKGESTHGGGLPAIRGRERAGGREIKTKIKSVQNTREVTRAPEKGSGSTSPQGPQRRRESRPC